MSSTTMVSNPTEIAIQTQCINSTAPFPSSVSIRPTMSERERIPVSDLQGGPCVLLFRVLASKLPHYSGYGWCGLNSRWLGRSVPSLPRPVPLFLLLLFLFRYPRICSVFLVIHADAPTLLLYSFNWYQFLATVTSLAIACAGWPRPFVP